MEVLSQFIALMLSKPEVLTGIDHLWFACNESDASP